MGRSAKKGPYVDPKLFAKVQAKKGTAEESTPIKTWSRRSTIPPDFVGRYFDVHNGKIFIRVFVREEMVGHKLGEFAPSRVFKVHGGGKKEEPAKGGGGATPPAGGGAAKG